jgi:hypothetical protein
LADGYHPYGSAPTGEKRAATVNVTGPVLALTKSGAATSSVPASRPGRSTAIIDVFGFQLFCAFPTFSLYPRATRIWPSVGS